MNLSPEEREKIYLEEKLKRETNESNSSTLIPILSVATILAIISIFYLTKKLPKRVVSIEDLRKSYSGLSPEEME